MPVSTLHKILRKLIYTGEFEYGGKRFQGIHEPLVSRVVWERCQEILDGRHEKKHRQTKHDFAFSGFITCGHCGCSLVGEIKKGRYVYYHCTGYRGKCPERYTREEHLTNSFAERLRGLVIGPEIIEWLQAELITSDLTEQAAREGGTTPSSGLGPTSKATRYSLRRPSRRQNRRRQVRSEGQRNPRGSTTHPNEGERM
jgi:hypothetical protein